MFLVARDPAGEHTWTP